MPRSAPLALALLLLALTLGAARADTVPIKAIRFGHDAERVRVVLDLAAPVPFTWDSAADGRRLTVTLLGIDWQPAKSQTLQGAEPLLGYRFEPAPGGAGQIELEAAKPLRVQSVREMPAEPGVPLHRIVIDLVPKAAEAKPDEVAAAFLEGVRAVLGVGGAVDFTLAAEAFAKAAEAGSAPAAFNLGELCRAGKGVPQDYRQAAAWFERAAEAGFAPARFHLAVLAFNGVGVPRDRARARELIEKAAAQGLPQARQALAELDRVALRLSQTTAAP